MKTDENPVVQDIKYKLARLEFKLKIEPVSVRIHGGTKLFMERIIGTTKYLSHLRKVIYDIRFKKLYYHNNNIPQNFIAVNNWLLEIENQAHIEVPEKFLEILDRPEPIPTDIQFYLDGILYLHNVPSLKADDIKNDLLKQRHNGTMIYDVLKMVDLTGNITEFHASVAVKNRMNVAKGIAHLQMMINHD